MSIVKFLIRVALLSSILFNFSFGCATCQLMVPSVEAEVKVTVIKKELQNIEFIWHFSDLYTSEMINQFDKNRNYELDEEELDFILQAMLDYLQPKEMVTSIQYSDDSSMEAMSLHPKYKDFSLKLVDGFLIFSYSSKLHKKLSHNAILSVAFKDDESYFAFIMEKLKITTSEFSYTTNLYLFTASILFEDKSLKVETPQTPVVKKTEKKVIEEIKPIPLEKEESLQENFLKKSMNKIKSLFESIKDEKNPMTYLFLLFFAYLYGVIHALGPGHGKTLVASYFLSNDRSYTKAFFISLAIGVVHTFSAFILTVVIYFVLNTLLAQFLDDTVFYTTKISALIIISIAIYLIFSKYKLYKRVAQERKKSQYSFSSSSPHLSTCGCSSCKVDKDSTDIALIISAGIIPCPGTTTLFIFAISTGLYYAGFISALVMSLGMSSVIFFSALLSTMVRTKLLKSSDRLKKYLEFISLTFILLLGGVLLFS